ncbi:MAG: hypothetical protein JKX81_01430 [Arenicella sp.]|nr:hypothetical protein [Arenicella sp.]
MKNLLVGLAVASVLMSPFVISSSVLAWGDECEFTRDIERELSLSDSSLLTVVAGAGKLEIIGDAGRKTILIEAKLCAERESQLADMGVSSELKSDVTYVKTKFAKGLLWGTDSDGAYIDLTLHVPANAKLDVTDSSGKASVVRAASLVMVDSSGELLIEDIGGNVTVEDSSGSLRINRVNGNVSVTDSSGSIKVTYVAGNFTVEVDSSGSINAEYVKGNVLVRSDSSGSINAYKVGGDFTVVEDSSGGIEHKDVAGKVSVPD